MPTTAPSRFKHFAPAYLLAGGWLWLCHQYLYWLALSVCILHTKGQDTGPCEASALRDTVAIAALALIPIGWAHWRRRRTRRATPKC